MDLYPDLLQLQLDADPLLVDHDSPPRAVPPSPVPRPRAHQHQGHPVPQQSSPINDSCFSYLLAAHAANEVVVKYMTSILDEEEESFILDLHRINNKILIHLCERFVALSETEGVLPHAEKINKIEAILNNNIRMNVQLSVYSDIMATALEIIKKFHNHIHLPAILESVAYSCQNMNNNEVAGPSDVMALLNIVKQLVMVRRMCCALASAPSVEKILSFIFFLASEKTAPLCTIAIQILQRFIATISQEDIELERFLNSGYMLFLKNTLQIITNSNAENGDVSKLIFCTIQIISKKIFGRCNTMTAHEILDIISKRLRRLRVVPDVGKIDTYVANLFGYATKAMYEDFFSTYTQMLHDTTKLACQPSHSKLSPKSPKVSPASTCSKVSHTPTQHPTCSHMMGSSDEVEEEVEEMAYKSHKKVTKQRNMTPQRRGEMPENSSNANKARRMPVETDESDEEDYNDYHHPQKNSTQQLLANIPESILNMDEHRPERVATKSMPYIFTHQEILTCMLPPITVTTQRKPFPPKKVEILYALLEYKFPNVDPQTYMRNVKAFVGDYCRTKKSKHNKKKSQQ